MQNNLFWGILEHIEQSGQYNISTSAFFVYVHYRSQTDMNHMQIQSSMDAKEEKTKSGKMKLPMMRRKDFCKLATTTRLAI